MQTVKFITVDDMSKEIKDRKVTVWCTTNDLKLFRDFMQYAVDNCNKPEEYMIWDIEKDTVYDMYKIATEQYKMRKRTFEERMKNIQTGKWIGLEV